MKIKIYIITYNEPDVLNNNLESLFESKKENINLEINVINNHTNFYLNDKFKNSVKILHNMVRPNFSRGHLSRNWNQALINGFQDLNNPACDVVIGCQDDSIWDINAFEKLKHIHNYYNFYTCSAGDGFWSITAEAVKTIGIWDERFCGITFQEADFFVRALKYNKSKSSINDMFGHGRSINPCEDIVKRSHSGYRIHGSNNYLYQYHKNLFIQKWGGFPPEYWPENAVVPDCQIVNYVLYPYFEKDIDMTNKNYSPLYF